MQRLKITIVGIVFLLALLSFACAFTVRFTESAVVTRFGQAGENAVKSEPGLYFKLPYPFESVTKYDTRMRTLTLKPEQQQTSDSKQVVVEVFCTWRVSDPLKFFRRFSNAGDRSDEHYRQAEASIDSAIRSSMGIVSKFSMDEMFTTAGGSKLEEIERRMLDNVRAASDKGGLMLGDFGISVETVGLTRIVLPEEVTKAVFERMRSSRDRLTKEIEARGAAEAQAISSRAENDARRIQDFAERLAEEIRTQGDRESSEYIAQMNARPELAKFQLAMDFLQQAYAKHATIVLSGTTPGVGLIFPDALAGLEEGKVPQVVRRNWLSDVMDRGSAPPSGPKANTPATTGGRP